MPLGVVIVSKGVTYQDTIVRVGLNYRFGPRGRSRVFEGLLAAPATYGSAYEFLPSTPIFADKEGSAADDSARLKRIMSICSGRWQAELYRRQQKTPAMLPAPENKQFDGDLCHFGKRFWIV
jgi:hypothetical protein